MFIDTSGIHQAKARILEAEKELRGETEKLVESLKSKLEYTHKNDVITLLALLMAQECGGVGLRNAIREGMKEL